MSFIFLIEQSFGNLPKPSTVKNILQINSNSKDILNLYDTNPNLVALIDSDDGKIVLKRFGWRSKFHFFISPFMHSRSRMSWDIATILDSVNITPKPLCVYTKIKFGFKFENFFISKAIEPHKTFRKFINVETDKNKIQKVIQNLAVAIAQMHTLGIYHRDLTTGNFLVDKKLNIFIVDLNRAQNVLQLSIKQRLKDISKIHFKDTNTFPQENSIEHFFIYYSTESGIELDWIDEYWKYRKKLVSRRKRSKKIKNLLR